MQIEAPIIVILAFSIKYIMFNLKNEKHFRTFYLLLFFTMIAIFIMVFSTNINKFSIEKIYIKGKLETPDKFISRIIVHYFALLGFLIILSITLYQVHFFKKNKINNLQMTTFIIILITSITIDWLLHPWAIQEWRKSIYNIDRNILFFRTYIVSGIFKSMFHIFISIPIVPIIYSII